VVKMEIRVGSSCLATVISGCIVELLLLSLLPLHDMVTVSIKMDTKTKIADRIIVFDFIINLFGYFF